MEWCAAERFALAAGGRAWTLQNCLKMATNPTRPLYAVLGGALMIARKGRFHSVSVFGNELGNGVHFLCHEIDPRTSEVLFQVFEG